VIVFATFGLVWQLCAEGRLALLAAALATSPPMLTQASAILNPDIGLTAATTALAYACVRLRRRGATAVGVAIVVVAALAVALAKPIGTAFAVVELAALLGWPWVLERPRRNSAVAAVAVAGGLAAIVGVAGDQFNLAAVRQHGILPSARFFLTYLWNFYFPPVLGLARDYVPGPLTSPLPVWAVWVKSGVGWFGYLNLTLPLWAYQLAAGSVVAALGAATGVLAREARHVTPAVRGWIVVRGVVPLAATIAGFALALHLAEAASILTNGARIMQGRYLLPAWPLFAALLALPFALGRVRAGCVVLGALCLVWLLLSLVSLDAILRYYAT
jgi:hypothetical protein